MRISECVCVCDTITDLKQLFQSPPISILDIHVANPMLNKPIHQAVGFILHHPSSSGIPNNRPLLKMVFYWVCHEIALSPPQVPI